MPTMTQAGYTPPQDAPKRQPPKAHSSKKPKKRKKKGGIGTAGIVSLIIFLIAVLIGSATLFLYAKTEPYSDTFLPGTSVSGYELGGLTAQDGAQALERLTQSSIDAWHCDLTYGDRTEYIAECGYGGDAGAALAAWARRKYADALSANAQPAG